MAIMTNRVLFVFLAGILLLCGCKDQERCNTPIGDARCTIEPDSPLYHSLNTVGGYEYLIGGYRGLVVIRTALNDFICFERACPACHEVAVEASSDWGASVLECPQCGSRFSSYTDGIPLDGSATRCPLNQYSTTFDGRSLHIY